MANKIKTRIYKLWIYLKNACIKPNATDYASFGGKGIKWCDRWMSFDTFLADVGEPPSGKHRLRRINESEGYSPNNVQWVEPLGLCNTRVYKIWENMHSRCGNANHSSYHRYGERGITICERWYKFKNFWEDMGEPPTVKHSLDRYPDNNGPYDPSNCRWATPSEQMRNTRFTIFLEFNGEKLCLDDWAEKLGINKGTLSTRLKDGWSVERVLTTPVVRQATKLSDQQISEIRSRYVPLCPKNGITALAREFKVRDSRISQLVKHPSK